MHLYLERFEGRKTSCLDPFQRHKKPVKKGLSVIDFVMADFLSIKLSKAVIPGCKLCPRCVGDVKKTDMWEHVPEIEMRSNTDDDWVITRGLQVDNLNRSLEFIDCSPMKIAKLTKSKRVSYGRRKMEKAHQLMENSFAAAFDIPLEKIKANSTQCSQCKDLDDLMLAVKQKCSKATANETVQLVTLAPQSWTISQTVSILNVSKHLVKKARTLREAAGILAIPGKRKGHVLSEDVTAAAIAFYQEDEISRVCPGQKDFVTVRTIVDGHVQREHKQKRLLLANLHEIYVDFKKKTNY